MHVACILNRFILYKDIEFRQFAYCSAVISFLPQFSSYGIVASLKMRALHALKMLNCLDSAEMTSVNNVNKTQSFIVWSSTLCLCFKT
ncbi:hypothetical protein [Singapore grouper iridovirus]|nr:hypothetical protein [Singapore grouper iridovirus]